VTASAAAREPSPDAVSAAAAGVVASDPIGLATDDSQTWLCPPVSPGAEEFSESTSASISLSASDDVSSIPSCALNGVLRIFCGGTLASPLIRTLSFRRIDPCGDLRMAVASEAPMRLARAASDASVSSSQRPLTPVRREQTASRSACHRACSTRRGAAPPVPFVGFGRCEHS
jgi:hypothetical protein